MEPRFATCYVAGPGHLEAKLTDTNQVAEPKSPRKSARVLRGKSSETVSNNGTIATAAGPGFPKLDEFIPPDPVTDDGDGELANLDPESADDIFSTDPDAEPNPEVEQWIKTAQTHGAGAPVRIEIRKLVGGDEHKRGLRPMRGYIDLHDITSAGSLERAVAIKVNHAPGTYVVQFVDPIGKRRIGEARYVKVLGAESNADVRSLDEAILKTKKLAELATAQTELETIKGGGRGTEALEQMVRNLAAQVSRLTERAAQPPTPAPTLLDRILPILAPVIPKLLERILSPPAPASLDMMKDVISASVKFSLEASAASQASVRERENMVFEQMLSMMRKQSGLPEAESEDDSMVGLASKVIDLLAASKAQPVAQVAADTPARSAPTMPKPVTPFVLFARKLVGAAQRSMAPLAAAASAVAEWRGLTEPARIALVRGDQTTLEELFGQLPDDLYAGVTQALQNDGFRSWYGAVIYALANNGKQQPSAEPSAAEPESSSAES